MVMFISFFTINSMATQSFFTYIFCLQHFGDKPAFSNETLLKELCANQITKNGSYKDDLTNLSAKTSEWVFYIGLVMYGPGFFSAVVLGALSDLYSRKLSVLVPATGNMIGMVICYLITKFASTRFTTIFAKTLVLDQWRREDLGSGEHLATRRLSRDPGW